MAMAKETGQGIPVEERGGYGACRFTFEVLPS